MTAPLLVVLRALGLGDLLASVPALRALARAFPDHHRVLAAPAALGPLVELVGGVDEVLDTRPLAPLPPRLHGADVAVNLHGRGPQSTARLLASSPRRLVAFRGEGVAGPCWRADEHETLRWCRLLEESGIPADPDDLDLHLPRHTLLLHAPATAWRGAVVVHPGSAAPARRWPPERWAAVARALAFAGQRVVVTGTAEERPLAEAVASAAGLPAGAVAAGQTSLLDLVVLVAHARRVVSADTGVAHLATALRVPSVVIFGPVPPSEWGPPPGRALRHRALWAGRRGDTSAAEPDPGLLAVTVDDVLAALADLDDLGDVARQGGDTDGRRRAADGSPAAHGGRTPTWASPGA